VARVLGLDYGGARIGVAISDPTGSLARPLTVVAADRPDAIDNIVALVGNLAREEAGLAAIVVGLPCRLDGSPHEMTSRVRAFVDALAGRVGVPVVCQDERLSSREAESRLAECHRSWQRRKARLDAAAAAVILQDHLDERARRGGEGARRGTAPGADDLG